MNFKIKLTAVIIVLLLLAQFTAAEDWQMFHHDLEHSGKTSDVIQNPENLEVIWKFKTGNDVDSSPAISGNYAYVGSDEGYVYTFGELKTCPYECCVNLEGYKNKNCSSADFSCGKDNKCLKVKNKNSKTKIQNNKANEKQKIN